MRSATECAPRTCKCKRRLPKPHVHGGELCYDNKSPLYMKWICNHCDDRFDVNLTCFKHWVIKCTHCQILYVWSFHDISNGCWRIRSDMPLFDTQEIVEVA